MDENYKKKMSKINKIISGEYFDEKYPNFPTQLETSQNSIEDVARRAFLFSKEKNITLSNKELTDIIQRENKTEVNYLSNLGSSLSNDNSEAIQILKERNLMISEDVDAEPVYFTKIMKGLNTVVLESDENPDLDIVNTNQEEPSSIDQEVIPSSLNNHKKYIKDFAIKVGVVGASAALTAVGVPSMVTSLMMTGLKITGLTLAGGYFGYKNMDPETRGIAKGFILGKVTPDVSTSYNFIKNRTNQMLGNGQVEKKPSEIPLPKLSDPDYSPIESHSLWEFFELTASLAWKVLKKIHELF